MASIFHFMWAALKHPFDLIGQTATKILLIFSHISSHCTIKHPVSFKAFNQFKSRVFLLVIRSACPPNLKKIGAPSNQ